MARKCLVFLVVLVACSILSSSSMGRKLLSDKVVNERQQQQQRQSDKTPTLFDRLYLAALPKGRVPASTPTKKGNAFIVDEKLIARHLSGIDRILRSSVPSPGAGH